ncbi:tricarballylate utilization 4Fe-4S protein TcuB [Roseospira goensis]|uniref:Citrate/tricarballylate utilization protein n=1 Tax=Roseospira goensis TaxID=391922 RepID=A0A7W6RZP7_9PROT|nr:tricarballylate utilization 4Fe-4S protein TcuB [Roseospira goensis]MBB4286072.1 citrate/tricarballylate utilization protein [Roseospira goensis]
MPTPDTMILDEARRQMTVCVVCKYCNGYCDVFRAADRRPALSDADLLFLANLCHHCRNCWYACQYRPPHAFAVALPAALARVRVLSWRRFVGLRPSPGGLAGLALAATLLVPLLAVLLVPAETLFATHRGPGAFHAVIPRDAMVWGAALAILGPVGWVAVAMVRFWRAIGADTSGPQVAAAVPLALRDIVTLRNLSGGGAGCNDRDDAASGARRRAHHLVLWGFLLTVAATLAAAGAHHLLGMRAPYPWISAPVLLGTTGGVALLAGVAALAWIKHRADPAPEAPETRTAEWTLLAVLGAAAASGLALLVLRETAAMGMLLALHLGTVLAFFVTLPFGKMMHAPFRALALLRAAIDRQETARPHARPQDP